MLGDGVLASRVAAALVGALTATATYFLGRELFGWRVGLAAAIVLAVLRWHLNFSRLGFNPISGPLCEVLAFWLLARAVRLNRGWSAFAWAGLALGIGLHAYTGFRGMTVVAIVALWARRSRFDGRPRCSRRASACTSARQCLPGAAPARVRSQDPITFNGRTAQTLIMTQPISDAEKVGQIWENLQRHALMFNVSGDMNGRHNLPGAPMLDVVSGGLVVLGLAWLLVRPRDWRTLLLVGWGAVAMSGGILTLAFEAPQAVRTFGVTPVLAVLAGLGLVATLDRLVAVATIPHVVRAWRASVAVAGLGAIALAWIGFTNLDTYFNRQMRDPAVFAAFSTRETVPARAVLESDGRFPSILASQTMTPAVQATFLVPALEATIRQFDPSRRYAVSRPGAPRVFLETEHDQALADEVARMYPDAIHQSIRAPSGGPAIVEDFRLEPEVLAGHRGVQAAYRGADGASVEVSRLAPTSIRAVTAHRLRYRRRSAGKARWRWTPPATTAFGSRLASSCRSTTPSLHRLPSRRSECGWFAETTPCVCAEASRRRRRRGLEWRPPGSGGQWQAIAAEALFVPPRAGWACSSHSHRGSRPPPATKEESVDPVLSHFYHVSPFARLHGPPAWTADWAAKWTRRRAGSRTASSSTTHTPPACGSSADRSSAISTGQPDVRPATLDTDQWPACAAGAFEKTIDNSPWINLSWSPPGSTSGSTIIPGQRAVLHRHRCFWDPRRRRQRLASVSDMPYNWVYCV